MATYCFPTQDSKDGIKTYCTSDAVTVESGIKVPLKLKTELSSNPAIPLLDIYLEKRKTLISKDTRIPVFTEVLFTIAKTWK